MGKRFKYKKKPSAKSETPVIGMLYIATVRMVKKATNEKIKHRILVVGGESADIERKLSWIFDSTEYDEFALTNVEKVREKIHTLSTSITQEKSDPAPVAKQNKQNINVPTAKKAVQKYEPNLYAIGITTTMLAIDEPHALRKVGHAIIASTSEIKSGSGATLSQDSTVSIEQIALSSGYASPRDVSSEINEAHFVRG